MADEPRDPVTPDADPPARVEDTEVTADSAPARRSPRPGVSPASRARRIGGRPQRAATEIADDDADRTAARTGTATVPTRSATAKPSTAKPSTAKPSTAKSVDAPTETAEDRSATGGRRTRGTRGVAELPAWVRWAPAAILGAGVIAMAIVVFIASNGIWRNDPGVTAQREQVLGAAKNCVAVVSTYKYSDLDAYLKNGSACSTGQFKGQFASSVNKFIKPQAPKLKATQTAKITSGGLQTISDGQWTVVVYGQVNVTNTSTPKGRIDPLGAVVRMNKVHGKWLIAKLDLLHTSS